MRIVILLFCLAGSAIADGEPENLNAARILHEAEEHLRKLQRLNETDALLEVQLKIAKKLRECQQTGYPCTGLKLPGNTVAPPSQTDVSLPAFTLPQLLATYQGRAQVRTSDGNLLEIQPGTQIGPWKVRQIAIDFISLENAAGELLYLGLERQP